MTLPQRTKPEITRINAEMAREVEALRCVIKAREDRIHDLENEVTRYRRAADSWRISAVLRSQFPDLEELIEEFS